MAEQVVDRFKDNEVKLSAALQAKLNTYLELPAKEELPKPAPPAAKRARKTSGRAEPDVKAEET